MPRSPPPTEVPLEACSFCNHLRVVLGVGLLAHRKWHITVLDHVLDLLAHWGISG